MHAPYDSATLTTLSHGAVLRLDWALRRALEKVLAVGQLAGPLWAVLVELASSADGMSFEAFEAGPARHLGRPLLLACLSTLQETGLIDGHKGESLPLLSHVRITPEGHDKIAEVIDTAQAILRRG